ncbi:hypothetical protein FRC12_015777 [Ceratobasidium sp. 428]|nr:hypothetical protein FRC12_015777 [Ceratobasidium sp. 428]
MPDAYAYVVVVPAPVKGSTGFRRYGDNVQNLPDNRGQYMFWIKIGDTTDPKSRLGKYTNPDQLVGLAWLKNAPSSKPGKDLEALQLDGIGKTDTEWHALYAYDTDGAVKLCQALRHFVRRYPAGGVPVAQDFALFSDELGEVISQRYDNNQHDGREIEPQDIRAFAIYIIVTPSLDTANDGSSRVTPVKTIEADWCLRSSIRKKTSRPSSGYGLNLQIHKQAPLML